MQLPGLWLLLSGLAWTCHGRKHHLEVVNDDRRYFPISTFGFFTGGFLAVNVTGLRVGRHIVSSDPLEPRQFGAIDPTELTLGFSIDKTANDAINPYKETSEARCILGSGRQLPSQSTNDAILRFRLNFAENKTEVECSSNIQSINIFATREKLNEVIDNNVAGGRFSDSNMFQSSVPKVKAKRQVLNESPLGENFKASLDPVKDEEEEEKKADGGDTLAQLAKSAQTSAAQDSLDTEKRAENKALAGNVGDDANKCKNPDIQLHRSVASNGDVLFNTSFFIYIANEKEEGLYSLYFHNCHNYDAQNEPVIVSFAVEMEEKNNNSYLSAGEMPLPALYLLMSVLFFLSGCFWVFILRKNGTEQVYRIHWIMAALVYLKSLSLFFHGINYHKIETNGYHIESWAVLYYITHLLKGGLLFFTIVLIGSGWAFVKHILSDKEKKIFMIVLPLQVLANTAYIIIEESEEGEARLKMWRETFILVDLLCCGAILFPVVWSIRHLQDSSQTDGKATISLERLKLFRHFYIMVVCYIYFTRIIVYLLKITVPFQYEWLDEMFKEMATFVFFVMTGYKFRPASNNPYFSVATDDYDMEEVLIGSTAIGEQVTNRKSGSNKRVFVDDDEDSDDDEGMVFFPQNQRGKESSHDLD